MTVVGGKEEEGQFREKRKPGESITFKEIVSSSWGVPGYEDMMNICTHTFQLMNGDVICIYLKVTFT